MFHLFHEGGHTKLITQSRPILVATEAWRAYSICSCYSPCNFPCNSKSAPILARISSFWTWDVARAVQWLWSLSRRPAGHQVLAWRFNGDQVSSWGLQQLGAGYHKLGISRRRFYKGKQVQMKRKETRADFKPLNTSSRNHEFQKSEANDTERQSPFGEFRHFHRSRFKGILRYLKDFLSLKLPRLSPIWTECG